MSISRTHILVYMFLCPEKQLSNAITFLCLEAGRFDIGRSARLEPGGFSLAPPGGGTARVGKTRSDYYYCYYLPYSNSITSFPSLSTSHIIRWEIEAAGLPLRGLFVDRGSHVKTESCRESGQVLRGPESS